MMVGRGRGLRRYGLKVSKVEGVCDVQLVPRGCYGLGWLFVFWSKVHRIQGGSMVAGQ